MKTLLKHQPLDTGNDSGLTVCCKSFLLGQALTFVSLLAPSLTLSVLTCCNGYASWILARHVKPQLMFRPASCRALRMQVEQRSGKLHER
jgi:hypothetical protein